jgi:hypothetical protein
MRSAPPRLRKFARRLLVLETVPGKAERNESAAFHVNEKLRLPLSILAGVAGYRSLLSRALSLANGEVRWLKAIHVNADGSLEGLDELRRQLSQDEIAQGEAILIAHLVGLLMTFIGEGLTVGLMQEMWPEVSAQDLISETEKDHG